MNEKIFKKTFKLDDEANMMAFLNNNTIPRQVISVCQAKNNDFTIFYYGYAKHEEAK